MSPLVEVGLFTTGAVVWVIVLALLAVAAYERLTRFHREGVARVRRDRYDRETRARRDAAVDELERMWGG